MEFQQHVFVERELEIAAYLIQKKSVYKIAERLGLTHKLVKAHIRNMMEKTGVTDIGDLRRWLAENSLGSTEL